MRLNLKDIILVSGGRVPFEYELDLSDLDFNGEKPVCEPVKAVGEVRNSAGVLTLTATLTTNLHLSCDRCAKEFQRVKTVQLENLLADHLDNEDALEDDDIILLEGNELDLDDALRTGFILDMDSKILCQEDCKGICAGCGVNLNFGTCKCRKEIDPRFAVLAKLLEEQQSEDK
jgi:uncharacterized protein